MQEMWVQSLGQGDSLGKEMAQPTPVFLLGKSHGQRSLEGYNPWGRKELDTTEVMEHIQADTYMLIYLYIRLLEQN